MAAVEPGGRAEYLQEKSHALKTADKKIATLEDQLIAARKVRESILRDIAESQISQSPIENLPIEILPLIFEGWGNDTYTRNRTLCLVCKTWYNVVWNSAGLWSNVIARPNHKVNNLDSIFHFTRLCHQRSQDRLVDITLDISAIPTYPLYVGRVLDDNFDRFSIFTAPNEQPGFVDWTLTVEGTDQIPAYPYDEEYETITGEIMKHIVGQNREHVHRWRSLSVVLGWREDPTRLILDQITSNMMSLCEMDIQRDLRMSRGGQRDPLIVLPAFLKLRRFTTNQDIGFHRDAMLPWILEHLVLDNCDATMRFLSDKMPDFTALLTLELLFADDLDTPTPSRSFNFPRLSSLKLSGRDCKRVAGLINAPSLVRLHLVQTNHPLHTFRASLFSNLTSLLLQGGASRVVASGKIYMSSKALKSALRQSPLLSSLRVYKDDWGDPLEIMKTIMDVRKEGYSLRHLLEVVIVDVPWTNHQGVSYRDFMTEDTRYVMVLQVPAFVDER